MITKTKTALIAALLLSTASAALAQSGAEMQTSQYERNPNAPVPIFQNQPVDAYAYQSAAPYAYQQAAPHAYQPSARLIEGRNVRVSVPQYAAAPGTGTYETIPSFGGY